MCGICGVGSRHPDDLVPVLLDLTKRNLYRGEDAVGNTVIDVRTGTMRRYVNVTKKDSPNSPMISGYVKEIHRLANDIGATFGLGQTKFTTQELSADVDFVRANTQPLHFTYRLNAGVDFREAAGICNGDFSVAHLRRHLRVSSLSSAAVDTRFYLELYHQKLVELGDPWKAAEWMMRECVGAGASAFTRGSDIFVWTDPRGIRPLAVGRKDGEHGPIHVFSSEDGFFGEYGIDLLFHMRGGEAVRFAPGEEPEKKVLMQAEQDPCWYERHYVQRSFSTPLGKMSNNRFRRLEGRATAEIYTDVLRTYDLLFAVPNSGISFENGVADVIAPLGVVHDIVCRKPGKGTQRYYLRARLFKAHKFEYVSGDITGKNGIAVDDSIVEGDTAPRLFLDWKRYGGGKLLVLSCAPPMLFPCPYGIGFPKQNELAAFGAFDNGIVKPGKDGVDYDIHAMNAYMTDHFRKKIAALAAGLGMSADAGDFRVLYAPLDVVRRHAGGISDSGRACDFCISGRRSDHRRDQPLDQLSGSVSRPK